MPNNPIIKFPHLQTVTIDDFTPGTVNGSHFHTVFSTEAQLGSASSSFRCYGKPEIGLLPYPTYRDNQGNRGQPIFVKSVATGIANAVLTLADLQTFPLALTSTQIAAGWTYSASSIPWRVFDLDILTDTGTTAVNTNYYTHTVANGQLGNNYWPNITKTFYSTAGPKYVTGVLTLDGSVLTTPNPWVVAPNPTTGASGSSITGTIPNFQILRTAYVGGREVFIGLLTSAGGNVGIGDFAAIYTSDIQNTTNISGPSFYFPESSSQVGSWGTVSTGEFVMIMQGGGAVVVYGDLQLPSQAITLPAVKGTGTAISPACATPIGLVYVTDWDGAWVWNGGNTSQKISTAIVDTQLTRIPPQSTLAGAPLFTSTSMAVWGNWVFFPNNWVYDCYTNAWWQVEDPAVNNFQVHASDVSYSGQFFYSSPGTAVVVGGVGALNVGIFKWDLSLPASSYQWISNPIPMPGMNLVLQAVEICASNTTSAASTITITPTSPPGQTLYPNQNPSQSAIFTIPANTASYRHSLALGYNDYNMCVKVNAASSSTLSAPILHEITFGYGSLPS